MSDFENLTGQQKSLLQIKLDGFIEAAVQAARMCNIGISEALSLTMQALLREVAEHSIEPDKVAKICEAAFEETYRGESKPNFFPRIH